MDSFANACIEEAHRLHVVLQDWLRGTLPRTPAGFAPFADALGDPCRVVSPLGTVTERAALLTEFEAIHGVLSAQGEAFVVRVENATVLRRWEDQALVSYEEWHDLDGQSSARLSTVLYTAEAAAPLGVAWSFIHETWMPGLAPLAGERFPETQSASTPA
ncbi:hypothetical protein [uncultured Roseobacter sp.]|uniref:hypothetical protein n=1 Tax=uncultured Roseobacter sp. TaxID=114847 RepID=UPI002627DE14|nr:hypothetical protein [uncultured Roseobacter sp.]